MKICKRLLHFLVLITMFFLLVSPTLAHGGKTDQNGGHTDKSTGEYHYHHGYPAHDHYDMNGDGKKDCPYNFDDQTDHSSSNTDSNSNQNTAPSNKFYYHGFSAHEHYDINGDGIADCPHEQESTTETYKAPPFALKPRKSQRINDAFLFVSLIVMIVYCLASFISFGIIAWCQHKNKALPEGLTTLLCGIAILAFLILLPVLLIRESIKERRKKKELWDIHLKSKNSDS